MLNQVRETFLSDQMRDSQSCVQLCALPSDLPSPTKLDQKCYLWSLVLCLDHSKVCPHSKFYSLHSVTFESAFGGVRLLIYKLHLNAKLQVVCCLRGVISTLESSPTNLCFFTILHLNFEFDLRGQPVEARADVYLSRDEADSNWILQRLLLPDLSAFVHLSGETMKMLLKANEIVNYLLNFGEA